MKLLFIGDIFARPGRRAIQELVPELRKELKLDAVFANGENARHGNGMTVDIYNELRAAGIDYFTGGDHSWGVREFLPSLTSADIYVLRPANYPKDVPGRGWAQISVGGTDVILLNLQGRVFMNPNIDNPFRAFDAVREIFPQIPIIVDFHAEATSEKNTFGHYVDGRAAAVLGTHTHVPTADERILPKGTAYISDVGMTGPMNGSIGASLDEVLPSYLSGMPFRLEPAPGPVQLNAVLLELQEGKAVSIQRIARQIDVNDEVTS